MTNPRRRSGWTSPSPRIRRWLSLRSRRGCLLWLGPATGETWDPSKCSCQTPGKDDNGPTTQYKMQKTVTVQLPFQLILCNIQTYIVLLPQSPDWIGCLYFTSALCSAARAVVPPFVPCGRRPEVSICLTAFPERSVHAKMDDFFSG